MATALGADLENGLAAQEASRRLAQDGPNELRSVPRRPAWRRVLSHFQDPLVYLLLGAVAVALVAWGIEGRVGWPVDAIVIALVVVLNAVLGFLQEAKAQDAVAALAGMTALDMVFKGTAVAQSSHDRVCSPANRQWIEPR